MPLMPLLLMPDAVADDFRFSRPLRSMPASFTRVDAALIIN